MMGSNARGARLRVGLAIAVAAIGWLLGAQSAAAAPAETTITTGPANASLTRDNTPTFEFVADQASVSFTCSIDSTEAAAKFACGSPYTTAPLADGGHVFYVASTNSTAETDPSPAARSFTVDATPPDTTITTGPAEGEVINTDAPQFAWASTELNSTFACIADAIPLMSCEQAFITGATDGPHSFSVAATDAAGNTDPTPATRNFRINLTGAPGPEIPRCLYDGNTITGTTGADTRIGTAGTDLMYGLGGNDVLSGVGAPDCITGQNGNDRLRGGAGGDLLLGGAGNDQLTGDAGGDELRGGFGNDTMNGGAGADVLVGEAGADRLTDTSGRDSFSGGPGNDRVSSRDSTPSGRLVADTVTCGTGRFDIAIVDRRDRVNRDCERVSRR